MKKINFGVKCRIYPTKEQEKILLYFCNKSIDIWNFLVYKYKNESPVCYKNSIKGMSALDLKNEFGDLTIHNRIYREIITRFSNAYIKFYKKDGGRPKEHYYNSKKQSFSLCDVKFSITKHGILIPKVGCKGNKHDRIPLNKRFVEKFSLKHLYDPHYTKINNKWYISGFIKKEEPQKKNKSEWLGLDWGIKNFMTCSNGLIINYPKKIIREYERIKRLQSYMDKKIKYSNNWIKIYNKFIKSYHRLEGLKKDFIEKTTNKLSHYNISVEDLNISKITKSNKSYRRIRLIAPYSIFIKKLEWKCYKYGTIFVKVNPAYTSKTCSKCGLIKEDLTLKDRVFECECGYINDRDVNAAINIAAKGKLIALKNL